MLRIDKPIIAVDIGATNIRVALTDGSKLIDKVVESTVKLSRLSGYLGVLWIGIGSIV